jgi:cell division septation protein DedD
MLHAANADGKPGSNPSPLSLAEVRLVFVEAPNLPLLIIVLRNCVSGLLLTGVVPFGKDESLEERAEWKRLQRIEINEAFNHFTRQIEQLPVWPFTESKNKFLHHLHCGRSDCLRLVTVFTDTNCWGIHRNQWNHLDQRDYETVMDFHDWVKAVEAELVGLESAIAPLTKIITTAPAPSDPPTPTAPPTPSTTAPPTATAPPTPADSGPAATPALTPTEKQVMRLYAEAVVALAGTDPQELPTVRAAYDWLIANGEYDGELGAFRRALARARRKTDDRPVERVPRSAVPKSHFYGR